MGYIWDGFIVMIVALYAGAYLRAEKKNPHGHDADRKSGGAR